MSGCIYLTAVATGMLLIPRAAMAGVTVEVTTQTVSVTLNSAAKVSVPPALTLSSSGVGFQNFTGTQLLNYEVRTTQAGSATLTVRATSEFTPANGPSIASGDLAYSCGAAGVGSGCAGIQTVSTTVQTPVIAVGGSACVGAGCPGPAPSTITLSFALANKPQFRTGGYSAQLQFTFSSL